MKKFLRKTEISSLPNSFGVYLFFGEDGVLLYVGKSNKVRKRVNAHFAARDEHSCSNPGSSKSCIRCTTYGQDNRAALSLRGGWTMKAAMQPYGWKPSTISTSNLILPFSAYSSTKPRQKNF
jgi:hypothetical protein